MTADLDFSWQEAGVCHTLALPEKERCDLFFPLDETDEAVTVSKKFCYACPVRERCLEFALHNRIEDGTWGGLTEWERSRHRSFRRRQRVVVATTEVVVTTQPPCPHCGEVGFVVPRSARQDECLACFEVWLA